MIDPDVVATTSMIVGAEAPGIVGPAVVPGVVGLPGVVGISGVIGLPGVVGISRVVGLPGVVGPGGATVVPVTLRVVVLLSFTVSVVVTSEVVVVSVAASRRATSDSYVYWPITVHSLNW